MRRGSLLSVPCLPGRRPIRTTFPAWTRKQGATFLQEKEEPADIQSCILTGVRCVWRGSLSLFCCRQGGRRDSQEPPRTRHIPAVYTQQSIFKPGSPVTLDAFSSRFISRAAASYLF